MITCYRELHAYLRHRADSLGIARERIDDLAGLPTRYASKLLAPDMPKRMSLDTALAIIGALGLSLSLVEDAEAMRRIRESIGSRSKKKVTASRKASRARKYKKLLRDLSKMANVARNMKLTPAQRSRIASIAARARWKQVRRRRRAAHVSGSKPAAAPPVLVLAHRPQCAGTGAPKARAPLQSRGQRV